MPEGPRFHTVVCKPGSHVVRLTRAGGEFTSLEELRWERQLVRSALDRAGRSGKSLLVDSRLAPINTDERLTEEFARFRSEVAQGFARIAILVQSKIGILQAQRLALGERPQGPFRVFDDELQALEYLSQ